ncbi:ANL family adenylate-forming protein [Bacteroides oleiciplenus]|uniref:ANL family adenylate-forming protein n=1 Tax=Bacteroides oleiciplenus TaxID=626931 RepID=UPI0026DBFAEA|nr:fatty acid--CoA ligase family protein [Bacteroides oleiciplenus]
MTDFLIDNSQTYTYADFVKAINQKDYYYPLFKTSDIFLYFANLVKALIGNQSLVLLDSDVNSSEIAEVYKNEINVPKPIKSEPFNSIDEIIVAVQQSVSKITIFTSGTTGQPKEVVHNISSLTRSVRTGDRYMKQTWAFAYNPTHMAGLQVFFQAFENKNTLVNVFGCSRNEIYRLIKEYRVSHLSATPTFYRLLLPYESSYPFVMRVTLGGEKSEEHLYTSIRQIFPNAKINNIYASTEAGTLFAAKGDCFVIPLTIKEKFKVENGELLIHKSLLGSSDSFTFSGEFYHSGDLIEWVDEDGGVFRFKNRKNEMINIGGYKVNPGEVEDTLLSIDGVQQVLVYGKSNSVLGNILCADIMKDTNSLLTELDIRTALKDQLQDFKIPRRIKFVKSLALTRTGKLKRS